jgi:hypothetical protein
MLLCADDISLSDSINTEKENAKSFLIASRDAGVEINAEKTKHMIKCRYQNSGQNQNIRIANESFENVATFRYSRTTLINQSDIHGKMKNKLNAGNACHH